MQNGERDTERLICLFYPLVDHLQAEAALQRLHELQMKMVGGELKGDEEIKDKRKKKMSHATKR